MFPKVFFALALLGIAGSRAAPATTPETPGSVAIPNSYKYNASTPTANDPPPEELDWLKSLNWDGTIIPLETLGTAYLDEHGAPLASSNSAKVRLRRERRSSTADARTGKARGLEGHLRLP